jgi:hypothetical protein
MNGEYVKKSHGLFESTRLERMRNYTENLHQDSGLRGRNSNTATPENKSRALPLNRPAWYFGFEFLTCYTQVTEETRRPQQAQYFIRIPPGHFQPTNFLGTIAVRVCVCVCAYVG